jgi:hypothetical protein
VTYLTGPHITHPQAELTIHSWFESSSKYYLAFPLLTGGELLAKLNDNGRFTEEAAAKVLVVMLVST